MANKVIVPDIGDFENVEIIEILVKSGDKVKKNDSIVTLESDKSSVEVPSTAEGTVENINITIKTKCVDCLMYLNGVRTQNQVYVPIIPSNTEVKETPNSL